MSADEIAHLDDGTVSPFEVLASLDQTIRLMRLALADHYQRVLMVDATRDLGEAYLISACDAMWSAREALVASVETAE